MTQRLRSTLAVFFGVVLLNASGATLALAEDSQAASKPVKTIACLSDGEYAHTLKMFEGIRTELSGLAGSYYEVNFLPHENAGWDAGRADALLAQYLNDPKVDVLLVAGPLFVQAAKAQAPLSKPVIITSLLDPEVTGLPQTPSGTTGVKNLYYVVKTDSIDADLKLFRRVFKFESAHLVVEDGLKTYAQRIVDELRKKDLKAELLSGAGAVAQILERIDQAKPKALYLTPLNLSRADHQALINGINERKIPTFSYTGYEEVEDGALAGRVPKVLTQITRRIAITIDRVLKGEDAGSMGTRFDIEDKLAVNQKTANQIGLSLPFDLLMDAEVLFRDDVQGGMLTLQEAVKVALQSNLNFRVFDEQIKAVSKDYWLAWTKYLPLVEYRLNYNLANFSEERFGAINPRENFENGLTLNQLIFSHPVLYGISNAKMQIDVEKLNKQTASLDITDQAVTVYLNYLRAKALLKVEQENLKAAGENLDVANRRLQSGAGGKEEVLRWEAQLATEKSLVLARDSSVFQTRVALNQLMNRDQELMFDEEDVGLETLKYYIGGQRMNPYVNDAATLRVFLDFSVEQALKNSPEIEALRVGIEQQQNQVTVADGKFLFPEIAMDGDARHSFHQEFKSEEPAGDNDGWDLKMKLTYPIFDRGSRPIESLKQRDILHQLEYSMHLKKQEIERGLRLAAYNIYNSLPSIELKRQAMASSSEEYEIMQAKYKEGLISYVDLVNIQAEKFQREADAMIALYDFFSDLSSFDRQVAQFNMLAPEPDRQKWFAQASEYLKARGVPVSQ